MRFSPTLLTAALLVPMLAAARQFRTTNGASEAAPLRLYVFDCGTLHVADPARFQFKREQLAATDLSVGCYLIVHPEGSLIWDVGAVPDAAWSAAQAPLRYQLVLADSQRREVTVRKSLTRQLASVGFQPNRITYLALSHYHYDHTANANVFAHATWLVRPTERDAMFAEPAPGTTLPATYGALRGSKTTLLREPDYDVFGDGRVVIHSAPGHTPGHQMLIVKLARTGTVVLSGDLYHYPEELAVDRVPTFEYDSAQTRATRVAFRDWLARANAKLWIQHDLLGTAKLRKAPGFYE
jgi:N-acyl homoserine lactone hydrolase